MIMRTLWMNDEQINVVLKAVDLKTDETSISVKREINVAKVRASSSRVLIDKFLIVLGKKGKTPFRFNEEELDMVLSVAKSKGINEEDFKWVT